VKESPFVLKAAVVAGSLLLACGLISFRAGAFHWLTRPSEQPMLGSSKSDIVIRPETAPAASGTVEDITISYSSKSGPVFITLPGTGKSGTTPPAAAQPAAPPSGKTGPRP
jgi:hypothetical protein